MPELSCIGIFAAATAEVYTERDLTTDRPTHPKDVPISGAARAQGGRPLGEEPLPNPHSHSGFRRLAGSRGLALRDPTPEHRCYVFHTGVCIVRIVAWLLDCFQLSIGCLKDLAS